MVKLGKGKARELWPAAVKVMGEDALNAAARAYGAHQDPHYIRDAKRWLRDGDYEDDYGEMIGGKFDNV